MTLTLNDLSVPAPPPGPADWNDEGVAVHRGLIPPTVIDPYRAAWKDAHGFREVVYPPDAVGVPGSHTGRLVATQPHGWNYATPYRDVPELLDLVCDPALAEILEGLLGEPAGVHLNLSGWVTTERDWHQDTYLNPPEVGDAYAAVWIALGHVTVESGPFQYVPGSHRWHTLTRDLIARHVDTTDPNWPKHTETILTPLVEKEIAERGDEVVSHLPMYGDVLIWHGRLYHRGSRAQLPGAYRPALIAHYSGIHHRPDMPMAVQHPAGGWYFPIDGHQPVR